MNKLFYNPISLIVFVLVVFTISLSLRETAKRADLAKKEVSALEEEVSMLQADTTAAEQLVTQRQGEFMREKIARNELLLQKPDEIIVQLPPITPKPMPTPTFTKVTPLEEWRRAIFWQ
jgi:cell division protein FtsB